MNKLTSFVVFVICAISVKAGPIAENVASKEDAKEFVSMNRTGASSSVEKLQNTATGKSMRPPFVTVYPQPFVGSPWKFQRLGMPLVVPRFGTSQLGHRLGGYSGYQPHPAPMYSGYVQPGPAYAPPISYQHQPLIPSTYNYAPYASNSYSSYGYRSADEDEKLQQQPSNMDQPLQSSVQYETRTYVVRPQDYPADQPQYVEYAASAPSEMQPREVMLMSSPAQNEIDQQRQYDAMMMGYSSSPMMNYVAPAWSESIGTGAEQVYLEEKSPYAKPASLNQANLQLDDYPSGRYLMQRLTKPYSTMNWAVPASETVAPLPTMWT